MGKGSKQRPKAITQKELDTNWHNTFRVCQNDTPPKNDHNFTLESQKEDITGA